MTDKFLVKSIMATILIVILIFVLASFGRIETGHVGVRTNFNKSVDMEEIKTGWYGAFFTTVEEYVIKEIEVSIENFTPKAKDNLSLKDMDLSIFYTVNPGKVAELKVKYAGMDARYHGDLLPAYKLVQRFARGAVYYAVAQHDSLTMHTKRNELENDILVSMQKELDAEDADTFTVTKVVIRQMITDPALEESIQLSVKVAKDVQRVKQQSELATAEAARVKIEAKGVAVANKIISESLTPRLIELRRIEMMKEFAQEGTHTIMLPAGGVSPLVSINGDNRVDSGEVKRLASMQSKIVKAINKRR